MRTGFAALSETGEQLKEIFPILDGAQQAVLAGDFNFCSSWPEENGRLDPRYVDLWSVVRPSEPGYTQDTDINSMLARAKQQSRKVRFDRILLRGAGETGRWIPEHAELLGTTPVDRGRPNIFPSDHFGLAVRIRFVA